MSGCGRHWLASFFALLERIDNALELELVEQLRLHQPLLLPPSLLRLPADGLLGDKDLAPVLGNGKRASDGNVPTLSLLVLMLRLLSSLWWSCCCCR
eukprot:15458817-Alexandrium_andersonii.AAC.1